MDFFATYETNPTSDVPVDNDGGSTTYCVVAARENEVPANADGGGSTTYCVIA